MVRVRAPDEQAEAAEDVTACRFGAGPEPEYREGPAFFVLDVAREPWMVSAEIGDEAFIALALPATGTAEQTEDRTARAERQTPRGVDGPEDLWQRRAVAIDVERHRLTLTDELVAAAVKPVGIVLETMPEPGLGNWSAPLEFLHEAIDAIALLVVDVWNEGAHHPGEEEPAEARRRIGRQVDVAQGDASGRGDRPGMPNLQLGQEHA
jgi:hypothetical protein